MTNPVEYTKVWNQVMVPYICGIPVDENTFECAYFNPRIANEWPCHYNQTNVRVIDSLGNWDWRSELSGVKVAVLCIHGTNRYIRDVEAARDWVEALSNGGLFVIERGATYAQISHPGILFPAVKSFLKGDWPLETTTVHKKR